MSKRPAQACTPAAKSACRSDLVSEMILNRPAILYTGDMALPKDAAVSSVFVVGQPAAMKAFVAAAPEFLKQELSNFVAAHEDASSATVSRPSQIVTMIKQSDSTGEDKFVKLVLINIPTEASRHNNPARPDAVAKALVKFPDFTAPGSRTVHVFALGNTARDAAVTGISVGRAAFRFNLSTKRGVPCEMPSPKITVGVWSAESGSASMELCEALGVVVDKMRMSATLTDMPTNFLNTTTYVSFMERLVGDLKALGRDVKMNVIKGNELEEQGFGGLWNVGKACTANPPALVVLSWNASDAKPDDKSIVLVGKGIVYDTGGLALKSREGMSMMKRDMGGSAGLLGAFAAIVESDAKLGKPLYFVGCLAENSIGPNAFRMDDIITMYSGLTVEINNTDAEGRLVMADGAAYAAKHLNPEFLIDMATLTGASGIAAGHFHAAIMANSEEVEKAAVEAGRKIGDMVHPLIFCPEFHRAELQSEIADMKNSVKNRTNAQVSCAGWFVYENMMAAAAKTEDIKYLHVDMAYPVEFMDNKATGYGVCLISQLLGLFNDCLPQ
ncbi:putative aminopeptidase npepl1 [Perkinsus olseni]|uniref:Putative aminopeptidase npepl1 n=1 Tax=Perkinsus olseni TaxID=32597 RepID=A0A7J6NZR8_PEROL|nr:putative aminopeptidase npepl1 [Perkinsus olseni]